MDEKFERITRVTVDEARQLPEFCAPDGTIAEIADPDRYEKMKGAAG
jgi:hypothetical protein